MDKKERIPMSAFSVASHNEAVEHIGYVPLECC